MRDRVRNILRRGSSDYLQLCADYNIQVCVPATPVQMFFLLRRQMIRPYRKPLIIITPKSLLRHKESVSPLEEFAEGKFQTGQSANGMPRSSRKTCKRVIFCSGKVFYRSARRAPGAWHRRHGDRAH